MSDDKTGLGRDEESWELNDALSAQPHLREKYQCPQCPSSFKRPENLKRHQRGHDEHRRFACHICGKSFSRSDILGRHMTTHVPSERRNDNPHRRRACRECARVRERCSRGEPCRRCAMKALCCTYPDEPGFNVTTPHTWCSSSTSSEPCDYDTSAAEAVAGFGFGIGPRTPASGITPYTGSDAVMAMQQSPGYPEPGPSQWQQQAEGGLPPPPPMPTPSALSRGDFHPYQSGHDEAALITPFFRYDTAAALLPVTAGGSYLDPAGGTDLSMDDVEFISSDADPGGGGGGMEGLLGGGYGHTAAQDHIMPPSSGGHMGAAGLQQRYVCEPASFGNDNGDDDNNAAATTSSFSTHNHPQHDPDPGSDTWGTYVHPSLASQVGGVGFGAFHGTHHAFQPEASSYSRLVDYDLVPTAAALGEDDARYYGRR